MTEQLLESVTELVGLMRARVESENITEVMNRELWDAEDCAIYLKCKASTVNNKYSKSPSWPSARGGKEMKKMYLRDEVRTWAKRRCA